MPYDQFKNVFVLDDGDLASKTDFHIVREHYSYTFSRIENSHQLRATIRNGKYTNVGGYPLYLVFGDGEPCCFDCARKEYKQISSDTKAGYGASFQVVGCEINWEEEMFCSHCNNQIPSAYGDDGKSLEKE